MEPEEVTQQARGQGRRDRDPADTPRRCRRGGGPAAASPSPSRLAPASLPREIIRGGK